MDTVLRLLAVQGVLGAFDNLVNHEWRERLSARPEAALELALHAARQYIYLAAYLCLAWFEPRGAFAWALAALLVAEIGITLTDFVVEDRTRALSATERITHALLTANFGAVLAFGAAPFAAWAALPSGLALADTGAIAWPLTVFGIGAGLYAVRDTLAARLLFELRLPPRRPPSARRESGKSVLIAGGTGFIGRALVPVLLAGGWAVTVLTRTPVRARALFGDRVRIVDRLASGRGDDRFDAVVNLAGEPLAGGLWTGARRRRFDDSRAGFTQRLVAWMAAQPRPPATFLCGSAIGYYGDRAGPPCGEDAPAGTDAMAVLCQRWEKAAEGASALGIRTVRLRTGLVLDRGGGMLAPLIWSFRCGLGTVFGSGRQAMSWIHRDDLVALIVFALAHPRLAGPLNAVAPTPTDNAAFSAALARVLRRPLLLRVPERALRRLLGGMADLFLTGQNVSSAKAETEGFRFRHRDIGAALSAIVRRKPAAAPPAVEAVRP